MQYPQLAQKTLSSHIIYKFVNIDSLVLEIYHFTRSYLMTLDIFNSVSFDPEGVNA